MLYVTPEEATWWEAKILNIIEEKNTQIFNIHYFRKRSSDLGYYINIIKVYVNICEE